MRFPRSALALLPALLLLAGSAHAANDLSAGSGQGIPGGTATLAVHLADGGPIVGWQLDLSYDGAVLGSSRVDPGSALVSHGLTAHEVSPGTLRILAAPIANLPPWQAVRSEALAVVRFDIAPDAPLGTYPIQISGVVFGDENPIPLPPGSLTPGSVEVVGAAVDDDGDTIPDGIDNCPDDPNPDQADPDGDDVGSVCDNCPDDSNFTQDDWDTDTVGDVCDNCPDDANPLQEDRDLDWVGDLCDDCPDDWDPLQLDDDLDGTGDACDNCPDDWNSNQADRDGDTVGDLCDNCIDVPNAGQHNTDGDLEGDLCDIDDGLILFLRLTRDRLEWQDELQDGSGNAFTDFHLYGGDLEILDQSGVYTQIQVRCQTGGPAWDDPTLLGRDHGILFYLVTGVSAAGESTLGDDSTGGERANTLPCL